MVDSTSKEDHDHRHLKVKVCPFVVQITSLLHPFCSWSAFVNLSYQFEKKLNLKSSSFFTVQQFCNHPCHLWPHILWLMVHSYKLMNKHRYFIWMKQVQNQWKCVGCLLRKYPAWLHLEQWLLSEQSLLVINLKL